MLSVDEFHGRLTGLVLAEIELEADDSLLGLPEGAIADVTHDDRFSGGSLTSLDERGAEQLSRMPQITGQSSTPNDAYPEYGGSLGKRTDQVEGAGTAVGCLGWYRPT